MPTIPHNKALQLVIHSSPLALGVLLSFLFWKQSMLLFAVYAVLVCIIIRLGQDRKTESWIFVYGMLASLVVEIIGTRISGYQSFAQPNIWGIPYWLAVSWGYGFVLMKRISLIIATGSPWTRTDA